VSTQVQQQNIVLAFKIPNLLEPNRRTTASSVDKSHPLIAVFIFVCDVVYHCLYKWEADCTDSPRRKHGLKRILYFMTFPPMQTKSLLYFFKPLRKLRKLSFFVLMNLNFLMVSREKQLYFL